MPIAKLTFKLPDESSEHILALRGGEFFCALEDIKKEIRSHHKYESPKTTKELLANIENILNEVNFEGID